MNARAVLTTHRFCRTILRSLLLSVLLLGVSTANPSFAQTQEAPRALQDELFIVRLRRPALVDHLITASPRSSDLRVRARTLSSEAYSAQLRSEQQTFIERISSDRRLSVIGSCTYLVNVVFVRGEQTAAELLRSDPDVAGVYPSLPRYPMLDSAIAMIDAAALWNHLGGVSQAGKGVKIAIVDSGIYQEHAMFRGQGLTPPAGYPKVDSDRPDDLAYTNNKVIVARCFSEYFPDPTRLADRTPADQQGHGTRVAAIAAGGVTDSPVGTIEGVAPMAFLGNYKIFGSGANTTTTSVAVVAALDQAAEDQMDVINLSIGGDAFEPGTQPEQEAISNAVRMGIVVVAAAGNLGPEAESLTFPGTSPEVVTVGAVTNGRTFGPGMEIGPSELVPEALRMIAYTPGSGVTIDQETGPFPIVSVADWDPTEEACSPTSIPAGALSGEIALVQRGTCTFQEKADNVFGAGARAMVVYNNVSGGNIVMLFDTVPASPSVMIERESGEALRDLIRSVSPSPLTALLKPSSEESALPAEADVLASFSGRGPNIDGSIKPDLVAVGTEVYTASNKADTFARDSNGTSFATPMVSGAAALLRQLHPDWPVEGIKSALVSTAVKTPHVEDQPAHVAQMGNGRLDLSRTAEIDSYTDPISLSFGFLAESDRLESRSLTLFNLDSTQHLYSVHFEPWLDAPSTGITLSTSSVVVGPGQSAQIEVSLDVSSAPDGGTVEGFVVISEDTAGFDMTVPVWATLVVEDNQRTLQVSQQDPAAFRTLDAAIQAAGPGNTIEITDSGIYTVQGTLWSNAQGVPLNGLTIRSSPGQSPTILGGGVTQSHSVLSISGLQRITLEGLHILGSPYGLEFSQSTGVVKDCDITVDPGTTTGFGIRLSDSRVHVYGNRITGTDGTGIIVLASEGLIQNNEIGDNGSGNPIYGDAVSLLASGNNALFDNSVEGSPTDHPGIDVGSASVLLKGNHIFNFGGNGADGILASSDASHLELVDNLISDNGEFGIFLLNGAQADLVGNRLLNNGVAGARLQSGARLTGRRDSFLRNGTGVQAVGSALALSNSLVAFSADEGISSTDSSLELVNDTVFGNAAAGISNNGGPSTLIANSISFANQAGLDLVGVDPANTSHNLIGDTTTSGDPTATLSPLNDPEAGDFSLRGDSSAVDAGDGELGITFRTDLAGHDRVVDGDTDGTSRIDIGALEYASRWAPALILPLTNPSSDEFVGLALTNAHPRDLGDADVPAAIELAAHSSDGPVQANPSIQLQPRSQRSRLLSELIGGVPDGWLELLPDRRDIVGFTLVGDYARTRLDGIALDDTPAGRQVLPEVRTSNDSFTRVYVVNPNAVSSQIQIQWISPGGVPTATRTEVIGPGARLTVSLEDFVGTQEGGYLRIDSPSDAPVASMELFGSDASIAAIPGLSSSGRSGRLYGAQLAVTPAIGTQISLINLGNPGDVTLEAFSESGEPAAEAQTLSLGAGQQWRGPAAQLFGIDDLVGWLRVSSDQAELVGSLTFSDPSGELLASLPLQPAGARESIFSHVAQSDDIFTGLTLLNPGSEPALFSIEVFDADGSWTGTAFSELQPGEKRARLIPEWIPSLSHQVEGFVRVRSNRPILGFELFGSPSYLAAVPQQIIWP